MAPDFKFVNDSVPQHENGPAWVPNRRYAFEVAFLKEDDGTYSAIVLNLPGCGSCDDTEEEAMKNVTEAIVGTIRSYVDHDKDIPWEKIDSSNIDRGIMRRRILVDA